MSQSTSRARQVLGNSHHGPRRGQGGSSPVQHRHPHWCSATVRIRGSSWPSASRLVAWPHLKAITPSGASCRRLPGSRQVPALRIDARSYAMRSRSSKIRSSVDSGTGSRRRGRSQFRGHHWMSIVDMDRHPHGSSMPFARTRSTTNVRSNRGRCAWSSSTRTPRARDRSMAIQGTTQRPSPWMQGDPQSHRPSIAPSLDTGSMPLSDQRSRIESHHAGHPRTRTTLGRSCPSVEDLRSSSYRVVGAAPRSSGG